MELNVRDPKMWELLQEEGYWRVSKQSLDDQRCDQKVLEDLRVFSKHNPRPLDYCLVFEKIDEPMSRYEYTARGKHTVIDNDERSELWENKRVVIDRETGEVIAYDVFPHLAPNITTNRRWQTLNCQTIGVEPEAGNNVLNKEVLKTK
jgi:uncharacterized protein (DUF2249 family)